MSEDARVILLVGHCTPDSFAMRSALGRFAPGVEFVRVNSEPELAAHAGAAGLLVNRLLDGDFATESGLDLIASLDPARRARAVLISNLADAQDQAAKLGAAPGFGKSDMYGDRARACIQALLGTPPGAPA
ncbi:MAG: hypothetical protein IT431_02095 [Phycisphaerales bacterium]|nr:hypothetical protein [Phycisphaerales bacterium]